MLRPGAIARSLIPVLVGASAVACSGLLGLTDPLLDADAADGGDRDDDGGPKVGDAAGPVTCDGIDLTQDSANCGSCGHDCLGGGCENSVCQPLLVASDPAALAPYQMILTNGVLYMSNVLEEQAISNVAKVSADADALSGDSYSILAQITQPDGGNLHGAFPYQFAVVGTSVVVGLTAHEYAGNGSYFGGIFKCPISGCTDPIDPATIAVPGVNVGALANGATAIVHDAYTHNGNDAIYSRVPSTLAPVGNSLEVGDGSAVVEWIAVDSDVAYVATEKEIAKFALGQTTPPLTLVKQRGEMLTTDATNVYFTTAFGTTPGVFSVPKTAVGVTPLNVSGGLKLMTPAGIAVDGTSIYFADEGQTTDTGSGAVYRCPLSGCGADGSAAEILSNGEATGGNPRAVVLGSDAVYWGTRTGSVWKVAK